MSRDLLNEYNSLAAKVGKPTFKVWNMSYEELVNRTKALRQEAEGQPAVRKAVTLPPVEPNVDQVPEPEQVSNYPVDKDVPIPPPRLPRQPPYPFSQMGIGDSFEAPATERARIYSARLAFGKKTGAKFRTKTTNGKVRIWRVS